jgi:TonB family protein
MPRFTNALTTLLAAALFVTTAPGQESTFAPFAITSPPPDPVPAWKTRLQKASDELVAGNWNVGAQAADEVLAEMLQRIRGGEGTAPLLGVALLYRSLGVAGQGREREAAWDFAAAQNLSPRLASIDLSAFGEAGAILDRWRLVEDPSAAEAGDIRSEVTPGIVPPRRKKTKKPTYPLAKNIACVQGTVVVRVVIDREGLPNRPRILKSDDPVLALATLDSIRDWRFKPARRGGEPVTVYYNMTVNYRSPRCDAASETKSFP